MNPPKSVSISGYGAYVPKHRIASSEIAKVWKGGKDAFHIEKAVAASDEDTITMAVESSRKAISMANFPKLGAIFVGTESKPYAVKPSGTILAQALDQHETLTADFEFACKAGTESMQAIFGLVGSGMIDNGLAVGVDTAQGRPGDALEYTAASASASYVISKKDKNSIATIEACNSYVTDTPDFWRRQGEKYPRHLSRFTGEPGYFHHVQTSVNMLLKKAKLEPEDFKHAIFHQPNVRFPVEAAHRLGFKKQQIEKGLLSPIIGNSYAASSPLGLVAVLDEAEPEDRILIASFGSGAGSDAISLIANEGIIKSKENNIPVRKMIEKTEKIDYATYAKFRNKFHR